MKTKNESIWFRSLFILIILIFLQVSWYVLGTYFFIQQGKPEGNDFRWFYSVGKVYREYGSGQVYDLDLARFYQAEVAGVPVGSERLLLPNHPPLVFPLVAFLARFDFRTAYYSYFALVFLVALSSFSVVYRSLRKDEWSKPVAIITVISLVLFEPFFVSLLKGQDTYLLLLGGVFLFTGWLVDKDWLAGLGLGLTLVRPQIAIVLVIPFIFHRRKIFWYFTVSAVVIGLYCFLQTGWNGALDYFHVLSLSTGVEGYGWDEVGMINLVGLILRLAPGLTLNIVHSIGWGFLAATLVGLSVLLYLSKNICFWHLALAMTLSLLAAPHLHYHDLALLAVPIIGLGIIGTRAGKFKPATVAYMLTGASIILLFAELWTPLRNTVPYLLMFMIPMMTWRIESKYQFHD